MTPDQAQELLTAVHDLQQIGMALGTVAGTCATWLQVVSLLLLIVIFFQALRRS